MKPEAEEPIFWIPSSRPTAVAVASVPAKSIAQVLVIRPFRPFSHTEHKAIRKAKAQLDSMKSRTDIVMARPT